MPTSNATSSQQRPLLSHATSDVFPDGVPPTPSKGAPPRGLKSYLLGDLDWSYLYQPLSVYAKNRRSERFLRFRGVSDFVPILLNIFIGIQHMGTAFGPVLVPPLILTLSLPVGLPKHYLIQSAFIISGIASLVQAWGVRIPGTPYQLGTGTASFLGNSIVFGTMYPLLIGKIMAEDLVSAEKALGQVLGTSAICSLVFIGWTLIPRRYAKTLFPPVVTGIILVYVGIDSFIRGIKYWGGGFDCVNPPKVCMFNGDVRLLYGSPEYLGFGLMVVVLMILFGLFGSAFLRQNSVFFSLLIPFILSTIVTRDGQHYVTGDYLKDADPIHFLWTETFKIGFHKSAVMPMLGGFLVSYLYSTAVLTGNVEESRLSITSTEADKRIQGGLIGTSVMSLFAVLATGMPLIPVAENNSYIQTSRVASRVSGISGALWLLLVGIFGHLLAFFMEVPIILKGGIIVPLATPIICCGLKILARENWNQRTLMIVTISLIFGLANLVVDTFVGWNLWQVTDSDPDFVESFRFAVISVIQVPYFLGGFVAIMLHLILPEDIDIGEETLE